MLAGLLMAPAIGSAVFIATVIPKYQQAIEEMQTPEESSSLPTVDVGRALAQVEEDAAKLASVVEEYREGFVIWSSGPDGDGDTEDDIVKQFRLER